LTGINKEEVQLNSATGRQATLSFLEHLL